MKDYRPKDIEQLFEIGRDKLFSWVRSGFLRPAIPSKRPRSKAHYSLRNLFQIAMLKEMEQWGLIWFFNGISFRNISLKYSASMNAAILGYIKDKKNIFDIVAEERAFFNKHGLIICTFVRKKEKDQPATYDFGDLIVENHVGPNDYLKRVSEKRLNPPKNRSLAETSFFAFNFLGIIQKVESITGEKLEKSPISSIVEINQTKL